MALPRIKISAFRAANLTLQAGTAEEQIEHGLGTAHKEHQQEACQGLIEPKASLVQHV